MAGLTPKQELFVKEYLIDLNATQAAIRAGYSKKTAKEIAAENLTKPNIAEAIKIEIDKRMQRLDTSADKVIEDLGLLRDMCMGRVPVTQTVMLRDTEGGTLPTEITQKVFEPAGAKGALELLGKHHKLFTDKYDMEGSFSITVATGVPDHEN
jgi:phage terminase small subunit